MSAPPFTTRIGLKGALGAAAVLGAAVAIWFVLPDAPNYDTATHLMWARELLDGRTPQVREPSAPTLHPMWLLACLIAAGTGGGAELLQLVTLASFGLVVLFVFVLAEGLAGRLAGFAAALFCASSFALLLLAFKTYGDLPFLALVTGALAVEARATAVGRPGQSERTRSLGVPAALLVAGLLRPEAWALGALLIALRWLAGDRSRALALWACLIAAAPVAWMLLDLWLAGDPLHSFTGTRELAAKLERTTGLAEAPRQAIVLTADLVRPPVAILGLVGIAVSARRWPDRRLVVPLAALVATVAGFLLVGASGLPLLQRYIQLPGLMLCVFAGVAVGWAASAIRSDARGVGVRLTAAASLSAGALGAGAYVVMKASSFAELTNGVLREARWHRQGAELLRAEAVQRARHCGPITLPSYRFVPELTVSGGFVAGDVVSRATTFGGTGEQRTGVAVVIEGERAAKRRLAWAPGVARSSNQAPSGFRVLARSGPLVAYGRCSGAPGS